MFRLARMLNTSNITEETVKLQKSPSLAVSAGTALTINLGTLSTATYDAFPDYILTKDTKDESSTKVLAYHVTENMVFKVDYTNAIPPKLGMKVGIYSLPDCPSGAVGFNTNGKGMIVDIEPGGKKVYVRFSKT